MVSFFWPNYSSSFFRQWEPCSYGARAAEVNPRLSGQTGGVLSVTRIILIRVQAIALAYDPRVYHRHPEPTNGRLICYGYDIIWLWLGDVDLTTGWYGPALINNSVHHPWRSCLTRGDDSIISEIQNGEYQKRS